MCNRRAKSSFPRQCSEDYLWSQIMIEGQHKGRRDEPQTIAERKTEGVVEAASGAQQAGHELGEGALGLFVAFFYTSSRPLFLGVASNTPLSMMQVNLCSSELACCCVIQRCTWGTRLFLPPSEFGRLHFQGNQVICGLLFSFFLSLM